MKSQKIWEGSGYKAISEELRTRVVQPINAELAYHPQPKKYSLGEH